MIRGMSNHIDTNLVTSNHRLLIDNEMSTLVGSQNTRLMKILEVTGSSSLRSHEPNSDDFFICR